MDVRLEKLKKWTDYGKEFPPSVVSGDFESVADMLERFGVIARGDVIADPDEREPDLDVDNERLPPQYSDEMDAADFVESVRETLQARADAWQKKHKDDEYSIQVQKRIDRMKSDLSKFAKQIDKEEQRDEKKVEH